MVVMVVMSDGSIDCNYLDGYENCHGHQNHDNCDDDCDSFDGWVMIV